MVDCLVLLKMFLILWTIVEFTNSFFIIISFIFGERSFPSPHIPTLNIALEIFKLLLDKYIFAATDITCFTIR